MNRPWVIWCVSALIALLVFGAMGAITRHTLGLEKERAEAEARAELEERTRIALWRMDTVAAGILAEENNRPSWHFQDVDLRQEMQLSPLNLDVPENVMLHFEIDRGQISSPQVNGWSEPNPVPVWKERQSQIAQGVKLSAEKKSVWNKLQHLLNEDETFVGWQKKRNAYSSLADNNLGIVRAVAQRRSESRKGDQSEWDSKVAIAKEQRLNNPGNTVRNAKGYQGNYNAAEKAKRTEIVQKAAANRYQEKAVVGASKGPTAGSRKDASGMLTKHPSKSQGKGKVDSNKSVRAKSPTPKNLPASQAKQALDASVDRSRSKPKPFAKPMITGTLPDGTHLSSLTPIWIENNIILVREVSDSQGVRVQGVWLDAEAIRASLLNDIADLLPNARLEPVRHSLRVLLGEEKPPDADDPMVMAALPWRLIPGEVAMVEPAGWTPMRKTLAVAWVGALLAAIAAVVLMRGVVKLSERRASFVSSVTHELRTPLTTFNLYSDMLAEGMVQDEEKKQRYLLTLRKESERLTHLVENVLAYSRIERGSARARVESVRVGELMDRMCERLRLRADEAGMELHCEIGPSLAEREIKVDTTAVEQIIFNLVDNASKYAVSEDDAEEGKNNVICFSADDRGKAVVFQVSDSGQGIRKSERKKLFKAFHKSAQDAAHSKPGVGLGLALCRRLARALGGDLKIVDSERGACFELEIRDSK